MLSQLRFLRAANILIALSKSSPSWPFKDVANAKKIVSRLIALRFSFDSPRASFFSSLWISIGQYFGCGFSNNTLIRLGFDSRWSFRILW
jgi:hypothetical protein